MARPKTVVEPAPDLATWRFWLDQLTNDMTTVVVWREVWREMVHAIDNNPRIPHTIAISYLAATYNQSQAVAVRRLSDPSPDVVSLPRLLQSIRTSPSVLTRDWWVGQHDEGLDRRYALTDWQRDFAGKVGNHLDPGIVAGDLTELRTIVEKVKTVVDKVIAHRVVNYTGQLVTYGDLDERLIILLPSFRSTTSSFTWQTAY